MNICTVGTSWITDSFIKSSEYVHGVNIYAVYSRSGEKAKSFSEKHGLKVYYSDFEKMLSDKNIDAVYIASPNMCHYGQSKLCLISGKHVICEKPAVITSEQLSDLFRIAEEKNLIFLEAMKSMHSDGLNVIKNAIKTIGEIKTASIDFSQFSSKYYAYKNGENPNIFNPECCAGGLMDIGVYAVYFALELFGEPEDIVSHCDFTKEGVDFAGTLIFIYGDKTVTITYSKFANGFTYSRILGDKGAVGVKSVSKLIDVKKYYNDGRIETLYPEIDENKVMSKEIEAFMNFADGKNTDYYDYCREMSVMSCRVMEKIRKSNKFLF